jgi:[ribosomal protein S5]-alanine N-acetyltransferase
MGDQEKWNHQLTRISTNRDKRIICETDNLILREFSEDDAEDLFRIYSEGETMRFLGDPPASVEEERRHIRNHVESFYDKFGFGLWAMALKYEGRLIGQCGILMQDIEGTRRPEVAYLIDSRHRGMGLASEAVFGVKRTAWQRYGFEEMIAVIARGNDASVRVAEKCGFTFERDLDGFKDFGPVSIYSRSLTRKDGR